jgi:isovaleryl-CoA dehydrogenase
MTAGANLVHPADLFNPTEEHKMLRQTVRDFVKNEVEPQAHLHDKKEEFNLPLFKKLGELGLLGITVASEFGGSGMDAMAAVIVHEELAASDPGLTLAYLAHAMLCVNNFYVNADSQQRARLLPKMCSGEWVAAMAMSEPDYGTDVLGMKTTAVKKGDVYILNGRKMWITNGTVDDKKTPADVVLVYARTGGTDDKPAISTFLVEKGMKGYSVGQKIHDKLGMRASNTAELVFDNCEVPAANRLGQEGDSARHMMRNLEIERLTLSAMSLGIARRSLDIMIKYAGERKAFGETINSFGQIQKFISESYAEFMAARTLCYNVASAIDLSESGHRVESDAAKLFAAPMAKRVADRAIQVLGGYGYVGEYVVERLWRDAKLMEIGGGTIEAHQKNMSRDLARHPPQW